jgi:hypothetical protein
MEYDDEIRYYLVNIESSIKAMELDLRHIKKHIDLNNFMDETPEDYVKFFIRDIRDDSRLMITYLRALKDKIENG